jgi:hypothetical protein
MLYSQLILVWRSHNLWLTSMHSTYIQVCRQTESQEYLSQCLGNEVIFLTWNTAPKVDAKSTFCFLSAGLSHVTDLLALTALRNFVNTRLKLQTSWNAKSDSKANRWTLTGNKTDFQREKIEKRDVWRSAIITDNNSAVFNLHLLALMSYDRINAEICE